MENQIRLTARGACLSKASVITGPEKLFYANRSLRERGHIFTLPMARKGRSFSLILYLFETVMLFVDFVMSLS